MPDTTKAGVAKKFTTEGQNVVSPSGKHIVAYCSDKRMARRVARALSALAQADLNKRMARKPRAISWPAPPLQGTNQ